MLQRGTAKDEQILVIEPIALEWSPWTPWHALLVDARSEGGVRMPNRILGVCEVRYPHEEQRLTIGRASDLRMRIKQGLVKGKAKHSAGKRIRTNEDVERIVVRWAATDRPAAAEEELHLRHRERFGTLQVHGTRLI